MRGRKREELLHEGPNAGVVNQVMGEHSDGSPGLIPPLFIVTADLP